MSYCGHCGALIAAHERFCKRCGWDSRGEASDESASAQPMRARAGWSHSRDSAAGRAYIRTRTLRLWRGALLLLAWPLSIGAALGFAMSLAGVDDVSVSGGLLLGGLMDVVLLAFVIRRVFAQYRPAWEGVVVKRTMMPRGRQKWWAMLLFNARTDSQRFPAGHDGQTFTIHCQTSSGAKRRFFRHDDQPFYDYFRIGDSVRYFPDTDTFDKYDKTDDSCLYCALCGERNPVVRDVCAGCGVRLMARSEEDAEA